MSIEVYNMRREYEGKALDESTVDPSPYRQFKVWFEEAVRCEVTEPNAMMLATVDSAGMPATRTVLLKAYDESGFVFYTNYESRKAQHIESNPQVSVTFPWYQIHRQLTIRGRAEKISRSQSMKYFLSRPFGSQIGAWISQQSSVISSRQFIEMKFEEMKSRFKKGKIPLPEFWGGYRIQPVSFEFWQGQKNRMHDRIYYTPLDNGSSWKIERLSP